jgi:hypothetical protein
MPAPAPHSKSFAEGIVSPKIKANPNTNIAPTACEVTTTAWTLARFAANPPQKSPAPQVAADANPKATAANSDPSGISA